MTVTPRSPDATSIGSYQLRRPGVADAHQAMARLYGADSAGVWAKLLAQAGLNGHESDAEALDRLLTAMRGADPVIALCARSLAIRASAFDHLSAAQGIIRAAL